ncbi:NAD(P)-dependent alcohol dehydrogenase [Microbacterium aquimaris]|uniref:NAD(P)-dependent alcohol dehydrogenase n=1 Tax=Microbacterium aquimaris TaxID=459816 RepID=UPI002AD2C138|nr:NAD(P)-dependent alcohol dehydrogenase [Microbacterium aquimaris]MDZ8275047.1 NAD(P)-dependent alcohol dehydrogenase [Microbacterium aquimaris]
MRAAVIRGSEDPFTLEDIELDPLRADEVLVEIVGVGMCHTDLLVRSPMMAGMLGTTVLGHEGSGIVRSVGDAVTGVAEGDHVLISFDSCGACENCRTGLPAYCAQFEARNLSGRRADGTPGATDSAGEAVTARWFGQSSFAELAIATERNVVVVDKELPLEIMGPLGCGIQTGAGSVLNEMGMRAGQTIAVFGAGAVGLAAIMAAKLVGAAEIVAVDLHDSRLELAKELGATRVVRGDVEDLVAAVKGDRGGLDFSFETTAVGPVIAAAVGVLDRPGKAVLVGAGAGELSVAPAALSGRTVTYALEGSSIPQILLPQLIEHWQAGRFPFDRLIKTYDFDDINQAEADSLSGATIKPVLRMSR